MKLDDTIQTGQVIYIPDGGYYLFSRLKRDIVNKVSTYGLVSLSSGELVFARTFRIHTNVPVTPRLLKLLLKKQGINMINEDNFINSKVMFAGTNAVVARPLEPD